MNATNPTQDPNGSEVDEIILTLDNFDHPRNDKRRAEAKAKLNTLIHRARLEGAIKELEKLDKEVYHHIYVERDGYLKARRRELKSKLKEEQDK